MILFTRPGKTHCSLVSPVAVLINTEDIRPAFFTSPIQVLDWRLHQKDWSRDPINMQRLKKWGHSKMKVAKAMPWIGHQPSKTAGKSLLLAERAIQVPRWLWKWPPQPGRETNLTATYETTAGTWKVLKACRSGRSTVPYWAAALGLAPSSKGDSIASSRASATTWKLSSLSHLPEFVADSVQNSLHRKRKQLGNHKKNLLRSGCLSGYGCITVLDC